MVISTRNSLFDNRTGLNKVRTEWKCLKTILIAQARIRLYRVENFLKKRTYKIMIIRNLRVEDIVSSLNVKYFKNDSEY